MNHETARTIALPRDHAFTEEIALAAVREILSEDWADTTQVWTDEGFADAHCWQEHDPDDCLVDYVRVLSLYDGRIGFETDRDDLAAVFEAWAKC